MDLNMTLMGNEYVLMSHYHQWYNFEEIFLAVDLPKALQIKRKTCSGSPRIVLLYIVTNKNCPPSFVERTNYLNTSLLEYLP